MKVRVRRTAEQRRARLVASYGAVLAAIAAVAMALTAGFASARATATPGFGTAGGFGPEQPTVVATVRWAPAPEPAG
jgi:hypothetical protein